MCDYVVKHASKPGKGLGGSVERITPRYVFEARIRIRVQRGSQNVATEGWARDISETGISAFVAQPLNIGELVILEVPLASSHWDSIPAMNARSIGTQYGFQFTALSSDQRQYIRLAVRDHPEVGAYGRPTVAKGGERQGEGESRSSAQEQERPFDADSAFAERARMLIKRGYTPKVAVELVLHEMEFEQGDNPKKLERARAEAEEFLMRARRGLI